MKHFWNWVKDETNAGARVLRLEGTIADETWLGDEATPKAFREELLSDSGPITVWINSPGGDCVAAAQIYNMLMDYPSDVTVRIDGIAASAASVIAMAGTKVCMSPVSVMMIHNPLTMVMGDSEEMKKAIHLLDEVKESIINSYEIKTGLSRDRISRMMDSETWMNARKAKELGFCDEILFTDGTGVQFADPEEGYAFSQKLATNCLVNKLRKAIPKEHVEDTPVQEAVQDTAHDTVQETIQEPRVDFAILEKRLNLLRHI